MSYGDRIIDLVNNMFKGASTTGDLMCIPIDTELEKNLNEPKYIMMLKRELSEDSNIHSNCCKKSNNMYECCDNILNSEGNIRFLYYMELIGIRCRLVDKTIKEFLEWYMYE